MILLCILSLLFEAWSINLLLKAPMKLELTVFVFLVGVLSVCLAFYTGLKIWNKAWHANLNLYNGIHRDNTN